MESVKRSHERLRIVSRAPPETVLREGAVIVASKQTTRLRPSFELARATCAASSIDDHGRVAGFFFDPKFAGHGFLRFPSGTIKTFDPMGSAFTRVESIDHDGGAITGEYADPDNF